MSADSVICGRMGYELSTCFEGSELIFKKIIQKFGEPEQICSARYGFEIYVDLKFTSNQFSLENIYYKFLRKKNYQLLLNTIEPPNIGLTIEEKNILKDEVNIIFPNGDDNTYLTILSLADLFKLYVSSEKYKMSAVSTILSYDPSLSMSHQCGILALGPPHKIFLFYEPYGKYEKYGASYKHCYKSILSIFTKLPIFSEYTYANYHDYFGLPKGIQKMMLEYGDIHEQEYLSRFKILKKELVDNGHAPSGKWKYESDTSDKTFSVCDLMDYSSDKPNFVTNASSLYFEYNAKTCVSIFLVEISKLIEFATETNNKQYISGKLEIWYKSFKDNPSSTLLIKLSELIKTIYPSEVVKKIFDTFANVENATHDICKILVTPLF